MLLFTRALLCFKSLKKTLQAFHFLMQKTTDQLLEMNFSPNNLQQLFLLFSWLCCKEW